MRATPAIEQPHESTGWSAFGVATALSVAVSVGAGAVLGVLWGGLGGRIAMRVMFLTSDERLRGLTSDDGFEIGVISTASIFLVMLCGFLGLYAGVLVGLVRMITAGPPAVVGAAVTIATGLAAGAAIVHVDGVDFRFLEPLWLAVALFTLLPAAWAASVMFAAHKFGPPALDRARWGVVGWLIIVPVAALGATDLISDIQRLT
jgi:hypothetical protein